MTINRVDLAYVLSDLSEWDDRQMLAELEWLIDVDRGQPMRTLIVPEEQVYRYQDRFMGMIQDNRRFRIPRDHTIVEFRQHIISLDPRVAYITPVMFSASLLIQIKDTLWSPPTLEEWKQRYPKTHDEHVENYAVEAMTVANKVRPR
jgi:hypothetical protein